MRFHEAMLCAAALLAPFTALAVVAQFAGLVWWVPVAAFFAVSLPLLRLVGWMIDHS